MRKRTNVKLLLLVVVVVVTVFWMSRRKSPPSLSPSTSTIAVSRQAPAEPADASTERPNLPEPSGTAESSHARVGPPDIYPNSLRTPGATNPDITQGNIQETICNPSWSTKSVRPPTTYTNRLKVEQVRDYGYDDANPRDYEEDHLIPLELGGNPTDPRNLWPEPFESSIPDGGARFKDKVENYLHRDVCAGNLALEDAQKEIAEDWYRVYTMSVRH